MIVFKYGIYTGCREIQFTHLPAAPEKLKYAVSLFKMLLSVENLDINNQEILEIILQRQGNITKAYSNMRIMINKFRDDFLTIMENQQKEMMDIFNLINKKNIN